MPFLVFEIWKNECAIMAISLTTVHCFSTNPFFQWNLKSLYAAAFYDVWYTGIYKYYEVCVLVYLFRCDAGSFAFISNKNIHLSTGLLLPSERLLDYSSFLLLLLSLDLMLQNHLVFFIWYFQPLRLKWHQMNTN